ncbi:MAG: hypothetical protein KatS3mg003_1911 [Candidatus Nitrosocaldaceae archaeon]|nr:MAG: hypothetical protein KatS3mg003_1911 [Candidatus Nitrosocaldaceae archaeon]
MRISVAIPSLNFCGGAEAVTLSLIKLLKEKGYYVRLVTVDKPDRDKISSILGRFIDADDENFVVDYDLTIKQDLMNNVKLLTSFSRLLNNIKKNDEEFIINMYGEFDLAINLADLSYINSIPIRLRHSNNMFKNSVLKIYNLRNNMLKNNLYALKISNSHYLHNMLMNKIGIDTIVIHPPIDEHIKQSKKDDTVITVARISGDKNLEKVLYIADMMRDIDLRFVIIGRVHDNKYYQKLMNLLNKLNLNENVKLLSDEPRSVILDHMARAKIFLHTMDYEGYGLSIVESMLAGCIPIVPQNGGPWLDILCSTNGKYGFSYKRLNTASEYIRMLINDNNLINDIRHRAVMHAKELASEFYIKFPKLLELII